MKCSDVRPLLDLLCDGALETKDSALVLDHLKSCGECQHEWNDLEQLRASFQDAKEKPQLPVGLMERISDKLKDEERSERKRYFAQFASALPVMAIAATVLIIGFFLLSVIHQVDTKSASIQTASADTLVDDLVSEKILTPVTDRSDLARKLGYDLKYLRLPDWQMNKSGVYNLKATVPIARLDFVRKENSGSQRLSCYQAPQGTIHAEGARVEDVEGKRVLFGKHGNFQYALLSRNGRDYLFVTALSKLQLEEIVRGT
jgi:anti-sigma factor RsiW